MHGGDKGLRGQGPYFLLEPCGKTDRLPSWDLLAGRQFENFTKTLPIFTALFFGTDPQRATRISEVFDHLDRASLSRCSIPDLIFPVLLVLVIDPVLSRSITTTTRSLRTDRAGKLGPKPILGWARLPKLTKGYRRLPKLRFLLSGLLPRRRAIRT